MSDVCACRGKDPECPEYLIPLALLQAIAEFATENHEGLYDPDAVAEMCFETSSAFVAHLAGCAVEGQVISGCKYDADDGFFLVIAGHAAVQVGNIVIDWTVRQFDPEATVPRICALAEWRESWPDLGTIPTEKSA